MERKASKEEISLAITAAELNEQAKQAGSSERITQEQFNARVKKIKHIEKLRKSGKYRILSVDAEDYSDGELVYDFSGEAEALLFIVLDREENRAAQKGDSFLMRRIMKMKNDLLDSKITALALNSANTAENLRQRAVVENPITSEVMFLYNPKGKNLGSFPI